MITAKEAIETLKADRTPSDNLAVIPDFMVSGLLAHEAMDHASEEDEITKRRSFLTGTIDRKVVSDIITKYDNDTVRGAYGSVPFDNNETPSFCMTIIDHGIYTSYMIAWKLYSSSARG